METHRLPSLRNLTVEQYYLRAVSEQVEGIGIRGFWLSRGKDLPPTCCSLRKALPSQPASRKALKVINKNSMHSFNLMATMFFRISTFVSKDYPSVAEISRCCFQVGRNHTECIAVKSLIPETSKTRTKFNFSSALLTLSKAELTNIISGRKLFNAGITTCSNAYS